MSEQGKDRPGSDFAAMLFIVFPASAVLEFLPRSIFIAAFCGTIAFIVIGGIIEQFRRKNTSGATAVPNRSFDGAADQVRNMIQSDYD